MAFRIGGFAKQGPGGRGLAPEGPLPLGGTPDVPFDQAYPGGSVEGDDIVIRDPDTGEETTRYPGGALSGLPKATATPNLSSDELMGKLQQMVINGPEQRTGIAGKIGEVLSWLPGKGPQMIGSKLKYKDLGGYNALLQNAGLLTQMEGLKENREYNKTIRESMEAGKQERAQARLDEKQRMDAATAQNAYNRVVSKPGLRPLDVPPGTVTVTQPEGLAPAPTLAEAPSSGVAQYPPINQVPAELPPMPNYEFKEGPTPQEVASKISPNAVAETVVNPDTKQKESYYRPSKQQLEEEAKTPLDQMIPSWYKDTLSNPDPITQRVVKRLNLQPFPAMEGGLTPDQQKMAYTKWAQDQNRLETAVRDERNFENQKAIQAHMLAMENAKTDKQAQLERAKLATIVVSADKEHQKDLVNTISKYDNGGQWQAKMLASGENVDLKKPEGIEARRHAVITDLAARIAAHNNFLDAAADTMHQPRQDHNDPGAEAEQYYNDHFPQAGGKKAAPAGGLPAASQLKATPGQAAPTMPPPDIVNRLQEGWSTTGPDGTRWTKVNGKMVPNGR